MTRERLEYARRAFLDIRADNQDLELNYRIDNWSVNVLKERECGPSDASSESSSSVELHRGGDFISFDSDRFVTLQNQNQQLLRVHEAMSTKITELED